MTSVELRQKGYQVLVEHLGQIDAVRFLQEFGWGSGDYTKERSQTTQITRETFLQDLKQLRAKKETK